MKKDIIIPEVTNVYIAIVKEYNKIHRVDDWNVYIINNGGEDLETVLIMSKGSDEATGMETSVMRHKIEKLPKHSYAKVEFIQEDLFKLDNHFHVSFFKGTQLLDKKFTFKKNTIKDSALRMVSQLEKKGILLK